LICIFDCDLTSVWLQIPFEDQMHVFDDALPNEVRIVIATNAAESSVTLPAVDSVICLGLCKVSTIAVPLVSLTRQFSSKSCTIKLPTDSY
jgi:HrpA-like RNA helicase